MSHRHVFHAVATVAVAGLSATGGIAQTYMVRRIDPAAERGYQDVHLSRAVLPGEQTKLWWATLLNPDCTAAGTMTTDVVSPPRHGQVAISNDPVFPNFLPPNPRSACDARKVPGVQALYIATPDFHGHDRLILRNATSDGRMRRIVVDIDVR